MAAATNQSGGGSPGWQADGRAVRLVRHDPGAPVDTSRWPATVPAVEQLLCEGLELPPGAARWEELHLVSAWRQFLTEPDSYFRHLLTD
jgi:hypothetical protein